MIKGLEDDMKWHRQGSFLKKMKQLTDNRVTPMSTILDESGQPLQKSKAAGEDEIVGELLKNGEEVMID